MNKLQTKLLNYLQALCAAERASGYIGGITATIKYHGLNPVYNSILTDEGILIKVAHREYKWDPERPQPNIHMVNELIRRFEKKMAKYSEPEFVVRDSNISTQVDLSTPISDIKAKLEIQFKTICAQQEELERLRTGVAKSIEFLQKDLTSLRERYDQSVLVLGTEINRLRERIEHLEKPWWKRLFNL